MNVCDSDATPPDFPGFIVFPQELLECPVCRTIPEESVKVLQCSNGHIICESCRGRLGNSECPSCRISMQVEIRNRFMEKVRQYVAEPCVYERQGCLTLVQRQHRQIHESQCSFRPLHFCKAIGFSECDYDAKTSTSDPRRIVDHLTTTHLVDVTFSPDFPYEVKSFSLNDEEGEQRNVKLFILFGNRECQENARFFLFLMRPDNNSSGFLFQCLCISRTRREAQKYRASFYFTSSNDQKCVASWPTLWFREYVHTDLDEQKEKLWSGAFHLSRHSLSVVQGQDKSITVLIRVKEKSEI